MVQALIDTIGTQVTINDKNYLTTGYMHWPQEDSKVVLAYKMYGFESNGEQPIELLPIETWKQDAENDKLPLGQQIGVIYVPRGKFV